MERYYYYLDGSKYKKYKVEDTDSEKYRAFRKKIITMCSEYEDFTFPITKDDNLKTLDEEIINNALREECKDKGLQGEVINYRESIIKKKIFGNPIGTINYTVCRFPELVRTIDNIKNDTYYGSTFFYNLLTNNTQGEIIPVRNQLENHIEKINTILKSKKNVSIEDLNILRKLMKLYERNVNQEDPRNYYKKALSLFKYEICDELTLEQANRYNEFYNKNVLIKKLGR